MARFTWAGGVAALIAVVSIALSLTGLAVTLRLPPEWASAVPATPDLAAGLTFPLVGALLVAHRPRLRQAWLMCGGGLCCAVNAACDPLILYTAAAGHLETAGYLRYPAAVGWALGGLTLAVLLPLYSPDGRLPSRRWRAVPVFAAVVMAAETFRHLTRDLSADPAYRRPRVVPNPLGIAELVPYQEAWRLATSAGTAIAVVLALVSLALRLRGADPETRRQIAWPLIAFTVYVGFYLAGPRYWLWATIWTGLIPPAIAFSVMRYRLFGVETLVSRAFVAAGLVAVVGAVYFGIGAAVGLVVSGYDELAGLAAALVAGGFFQPLRRALQRAVDRMLYGPLGDPRMLAERLTQEVRRAGPAEALGSVVEVVRDGLGVAGAAVEVADGKPRYVESGQVGTPPREIPLIWHGEQVGRLLLGPAVSRRFPPAHEERVLATLTPYVADVAHAVRMAAHLQRSREHILAAREEERRRLRRDLHDGLGQTLSSMAMTINMARLNLKRSPASADTLLADLRNGMDAVAGDIRQLVYGLRPPALDDLGLEGAVRALAAEGPPAAEVTVSGPLTGLPAAVEVAAYRIVQEALTNVRRHAGADSVRITLDRTEEALRVRVRDDGTGLPDVPRAGVGMSSMRERAAELGGTCVVTTAPGGGTLVDARLPC